MTKKHKQQRLNNNEVALLGLLAEKSRYGYELDKVIKERGMREWTDIAFSSIYAALRQLESKKLVSSRTEIAGNRVRRKYLITTKGRKELAFSVAFLLSTPVRKAYELDLGIANILSIPLKQAREHLIERQKYLEKHISYLEKAKIGKAKYAPFFVKALFDRPLFQSKAELDFINQFIDRLNKR